MAYIYGEHYALGDMLTIFTIWCTGCYHKITFLKLRVKITDEKVAIVCPQCGEPIKTVRANKHRTLDETEQELRKAVISLVNEIRFKMYAEREQRAGKQVTTTSEEGGN
ncbi:hypothetical protein [Candidatus Nitrososphaera gargensis]|uniref:hypothetical protein n=1 Tax=Candidatus Nitrososphaera gargensis TaxID=497727 RepID=UPI0011E529CD|nr:hypothetical protein [Candidatus Nitrososphaera gargensis]